MNRASIIKRVSELVELANAKFKVQIDVPDIEFYQKGTYAGLANVSRHVVKFNEVLAKNNPETFDNTISHEVAHLVAAKVYPRAKQAHGPEFKLVHQILGGSGARCHSYDVSGVRKNAVKRIIGKCNCTSHNLTVGTARKILAREASYYCKLCKSTILLTNEIVTLK
jgi:SprT protein